VVYQPKIVVVGQGRKRGYLGDQVYRYDPYDYLVFFVRELRGAWQPRRAPC
jgi:hypothetical protein